MSKSLAEYLMQLIGPEGAAVSSAIQMLAHVKADRIQQAIDKMNRADTIGPILDPTAWIHGHKPMDEVRQILKKVLPLVRHLNEAKDGHVG